MKQIVLSFLMLLSVSVFAQNFEGTISWSLKMEITDPAKKAKMEEAQKKMSDPATQAKMKEQMKMHEDKMKNDPQYKAMMESNPQFKAQMDQMAQMQGGDINSLMPTGFALKMKNQNSILKIEGGIMAGEFLHVVDGDKNYMINHSSKTYSVLPSNAANQPAKQDVKVTKTGETIKILNYTCTKYNVETTFGGKAVTQVIWATPEIKDIDVKTLSKQGIGNRGSFFYEGIEGFPLKAEMNSPDGKITVEVKEIKRESLPASLFAVPADYKEGAPMMPGLKN
jgi:hypothetical protein